MRTRLVLATLSFLSVLAIAQDASFHVTSIKQPDATANYSRVGTSAPILVKYSGRLTSPTGSPRPGAAGVTFALYSEEYGSAPLWIETQNVYADSQGRYSALVGSSKGGLPLFLFSGVDARWLGVTSDDGIEGPRTLLLSVPYAAKARDADTLGGRRADEFVTLDQLPTLFEQTIIGHYPNPKLVWPCPQSIQPFFRAYSTVGPSFISEATSGPPFEVKSRDLVDNLNVALLGGKSSSDFPQLDEANEFQQQQTFRAGLNLSPVESSNESGQSSGPLDFIARSFTSSAHKKQERLFRWQSEPLNEDSPSSQLRLLFGVDGATPTNTGLGINEDGAIVFAPNQHFPSTAILEALNGQSLGGGATGSTSTDPAVQPLVYTSPYKWHQTPQDNLIQPGTNTITLAPCPPGVSGSDLGHSLYISGSDGAEVVVITGGTCTSGAQSGTVQFQASTAHASGYVVESATAGLQEAINDAVVKSSGALIARSVVINPGEYTLRGKLSIRASNIELSGYGATLTCTLNDTCVMLGDPSNSNLFTRIKIHGLRFRPGFTNGTATAIEDDANGSEISDVALVPPVSSERFGHFVQVDNDQAALMDRIDVGGVGSAIRCDTAFCGSAIYAPGPFSSYAAVGWIKNSDLSMQCGGNGVDWQSGNTLHISDTIIQGYPQYGLRGGHKRGGYGSIQLDNAYMETGNCINPQFGRAASAGIIGQGGDLAFRGGEGPQGQIPLFRQDVGTTTEYRIWVVPRSTTYGPGVPLLAGREVVGNASQVQLTFYDVGAADHYDVLKTQVTGSLTSYGAPSGTGNYQVASNVEKTTICSGGLCTLTDFMAVPTPYTVASPTFFPLLDNWVGDIVLGTSGGINQPYSASQIYLQNSSGTVVAVTGDRAPSVIAESCSAFTPGSPVWRSCTTVSTPPQTLSNQVATLMVTKPNADGGIQTNLKGRLNMGSLGSAPSHIITLSDSNFQKTVADPSNRPINDTNDAYIGYDQGDGAPANIGVSFGAPKSVSSYIGNVGDGSSWKERLTSSSKEFRTDVKIVGNLTVTGTCTGCGASSSTTERKLSTAHTSTNSLGWPGSPPSEASENKPQQFSYSFFESSQSRISGSRSVYLNRAAPFRILEIYCETNRGRAIINLTTDGSGILAEDLTCAPSGASSSRFATDANKIAIGQRIHHVTVSSGKATQTVTVVVKYVVD